MQQPLVTLTYQHVDVFSPLPYSGNSLAVFLDCPSLTVEQMRRITQELRHRASERFCTRGAQILRASSEGENA